MKKLISILLVVVMALSFSSVAFAAQTQKEIDDNIATKEGLEQIVSDTVSSLFDNISDVISDTIEESINGIINDPELIKKYVVPAVANVIISNLEKVGIENAELEDAIVELLNEFADNPNVIKIYDYFMSNEFVQAVKARTIKYAVADAIEQIGITEDKEATIAAICNKIWNANKVTVVSGQPALKSDIGTNALKLSLIATVNPSYYSANVTIQGNYINKKITAIEVTGWNEPVVKATAFAYAASNGLGNADEYVENVKELDYSAIIKTALKNAIKDEITERFTAFVEDLKAGAIAIKDEALEEIAEAISELKAEALEELSEAIYEWTGNEVTFEPDATKEEIFAILKDTFCPAE